MSDRNTKQKAYRERLKAQGLKRVEVLVPEGCEEDIKEYAEELKQLRDATQRTTRRKA